MNEEKKIINEKNNNNVTNNSISADVDIFAALRERDESNIVEDGSTKVFKTGIVVQHYTSRSNGKEYDNYGFAVSTTIAGNELTQIVMISPADSRKALYETLVAIFKTQGIHYLEITKTIIRDSQTGAVNEIYGMQISCKTDKGVDFVCPMKPSGRADKAVFENIKKQLIAEGLIE